MKRLIIAVTAALALAGCSVGGDDPPTGNPDDTVAPQPTESQEVDAVSGRPLSEFEGSPTYEWRAAIAADPDGLVDRMRAVAPHLDEGYLSAVLDTCESLADGVTGTRIVDQTVAGFSGGPGEEVTPDQAQELVDVARTDVCP